MSKTIHRIILLVEHLGLSARQFDISIGTANGYTLRMRKNNASVGSDVIERIIKQYPQVNLVWLITGKGDMLLSETSHEISTFDIDNYINKRLNEKFSSDKQALLEDVLAEIKELISKNNFT